MKEKYTLTKAERLKSRKRIEALFREGEHFFQHPFRIHFSLFPAGNMYRGSALQAGVGVNSRYFKKAVDRNRIKRVTRECYRLQKNTLNELLQQHNLHLDIFLVYVDRALPDHERLKEKIQLILSRLIQRINENNTKGA